MSNQSTDYPGRMSDLTAPQDFINRLDEHLSKTSAAPGRNADTGEALAREIFGGATFPTEPRGCRCLAALPSTELQGHESPCTPRATPTAAQAQPRSVSAAHTEQCPAPGAITSPWSQPQQHHPCMALCSLPAREKHSLAFRELIKENTWS